MSDAPRPLALIPAYSQIDWRIAEALRECNIPCLPMFGCSDLPRARSVLLTEAMQTDRDVFLMIDADIVVQPQQLMQLVNSEKLDTNNAVSGTYLVGPNQVAAVPELPDDIQIHGPQRYLKFLVAGLGLAAVHRSTIARLDQVLEPVFDAAGGRWVPYCVPFVLEQALPGGSKSRQYIAEDHSFWWRLRTAAGTTCWLDTHVAAGHAKQAVFTPERRSYLHPAKTS